nr:PREDICTED: orexigenic neuropeptide QRFP isoform X1 [Lepisosteus oculatus]
MCFRFILFCYQQMKAACPPYILLFLELGNCFRADSSSRDRRAPAPWDAAALAPGAQPRPRRLADPGTLVSAVKELQDYDKERAGFRFRFGRGEEEEEEELELLGKEGGSRDGPLLLQLVLKPAHKRADDLEMLAEELNGYRRKGGFSFRFGRK